MIHRYGGYFLDEFSDLNPMEEECANILRHSMTQDADLRMVVAGYSLRSDQLQSLIGDHKLITVTGRRYSLEQCRISLPGDTSALLTLAVHLALAALSRTKDQEGNVIVFLPGMHEMLQVQKALNKKHPKLDVMLLHSDVIGTEEEDPIAKPADKNARVVVLSSIIGARSVTIDGLKYAILHPHVRTSSLHPTGLSRILDVLLSGELAGNMAGRVARVCDGLVTFLELVQDPIAAAAVPRPTSSTAGCDAAAGQEPHSDVLRYLDEYWTVKQWRSQDCWDKDLREFLPPLPATALCLLDLLYHHSNRSDLPLSPRLAHFVMKAEQNGVGLAALRLACIMQTSAGTFDPSKVRMSEDSSVAGCPLLALSDILKQDVDVWIRHARQVAAEKRTGLLDLKIHPGRIKKARALYLKAVKRWYSTEPSDKSKEDQSRLLVAALSSAMPELVARMAGGLWFCSGYRVKGANLPPVASDSGWILLFNPIVERWPGKAARDQGQQILRATFCCPVETQPYIATMVMVSDSSVQEDCFLLGLISTWRKNFLFPLWVVCRSGATAETLNTSWSNAPQTDFGLTIYAGNDFSHGNSWSWNSQIAVAFHELKLSSKHACRHESVVFLNAAGFFPALEKHRYGELMEQVRKTIQEEGLRVCNGDAYVGKMQLRDSMHFHVASTPDVVQMYSEVVITSLLQSNVDQSASLTAAAGQAPTQIVSEFSDHEVSCMLTDTDSDSSPHTTMLKSEFHQELRLFEKLLHRKGFVHWEDGCSSVRCKGIMNNQPWLRIELDVVLPTLEQKRLTVSKINALTVEGTPKKYYHGTYGRYALSIIANRHLKHGTEVTGSSGAGLWHGPPKTAVSYAWPTQWPNCSKYTMAMFELGVIAHKKHSPNVFVSKEVGAYEVTALLLHRYRGNQSSNFLATRFHKMRNGEEDLYLHWIEEPQRQLAEDLSSSSSEEGSWHTEEPEPIVQDVTDSDVERTPQELQDIYNFKEKVAAHARSNKKPMPKLKQLLRRTPAQFYDGDDRFNKTGTERVYACDACGLLVHYSRYHTNGYSRADATFMGSYCDSSWKDLPGEFREEAWKLGLIDASWFCTVVCKNPPTGVNKDQKRLLRAQNYKAQPSKPTGRGKGKDHDRLGRASTYQSPLSTPQRSQNPTGSGKGKDHNRLVGAQTYKDQPGKPTGEGKGKDPPGKGKDQKRPAPSESSTAKRTKPAYWT